MKEPGGKAVDLDEAGTGAEADVLDEAEVEQPGAEAEEEAYPRRGEAQRTAVEQGDEELAAAESWSNHELCDQSLHTAGTQLGSYNRQCGGRDTGNGSTCPMPSLKEEP